MADLTLRLAHLYGDVMNIYGDWGNLAALNYRARSRHIAVSITPISLGDALHPGVFDGYFFGGGQDAGQGLVAEDLPRITEALRQDVEDGAALLSVCGGYQLLGQSYQTSTGTRLEGAGILPVTTVGGPKRMMNNIVVAINPKLSIDRSQAATLVGFENHSGQTTLSEGAQPLGRVIKGNGNNGQDSTEGVVYKNAIGTYLHGSCLPKNPHLADWFLLQALRRRYRDLELQPLDDTLEWQAHRMAVGLKP